MADGQTPRPAEIEAGQSLVMLQVAKNTEYMVGCYADVEEGTEIKLMVYDGTETDKIPDSTSEGCTY